MASRRGASRSPWRVAYLLWALVPLAFVCHLVGIATGAAYLVVAAILLTTASAVIAAVSIHTYRRAHQ